ncbi:hypothetical protein HK096_002616 [Nowakowskiella sp. JEL0078]|nr:hypothetical protein HK096_002616 [Nowakowskiella sp. JEL0078]
MSRDSTHDLWLLYQTSSVSLLSDETVYQLSGYNTRSECETDTSLPTEGVEHNKPLQTVLPPLTSDLSSFSSLTNYYDSLFADNPKQISTSDKKNVSKLSHLVDSKLVRPVSILVGDAPPTLAELSRNQSPSSTPSPGSPPQTEIEICDSYYLMNVSNPNNNQTKKKFFESVFDNGSKKGSKKPVLYRNQTPEPVDRFESNYLSESDTEFISESIRNHKSSPRHYVRRSAMSSSNSVNSIELEQPKGFSSLARSLNQWLTKPWMLGKGKLGKLPFENTTPTTESVRREPPGMYGLSESRDKKRISSVPNLTTKSNFNSISISTETTGIQSFCQDQESQPAVSFQKTTELATLNPRQKIRDEEILQRKGSFKNLIESWKSKRRNRDKSPGNQKNESQNYQPRSLLRSKSFTVMSSSNSKAAINPDQATKKNLPWLVGTLNLERQKSLRTNMPIIKSVEIVSEGECEINVGTHHLLSFHLLKYFKLKKFESKHVYSSPALQNQVESLGIPNEALSPRQNKIPKSSQLAREPSTPHQTPEVYQVVLKRVKTKPNLRIVTNPDELYMIRLRYEHNLKKQIQERENA